MKKIFAAILLSLISTTVMAASVTHDSITTANVTSKKGSTFEWKLGGPNQVVSVDNVSSSELKFLVRVERGDKVSALCAGKAVDIMAGMAVVCGLPPGTNLQLTIFDFNFEHGSAGTYTFLK